jgi:hypothetical protein
VRFLLENGADPQAVSDRGMRALGGFGAGEEKSEEEGAGESSAPAGSDAESEDWGIG